MSDHAIKTYESIHPTDTGLPFDVKRMEDIYTTTGGAVDEAHRHDYYIVMVVLHARGKHHIDFNEFELAGQQVYFISPGQVHQVVEEEASKGYAITFSRQFMVENGIDYCFIEDLYLFHDYGYSPPLELEEGRMPYLSYLAERMLEDSQSNKKFKYQALGAWLKLLLIHCHHFCSLSEETNTQKAQASVTLLRDFKALLEIHYKEWHKVSEYAAQLYISPDHLNASIKSLTGKSVKTHIQARLVVAAKRLLRFSDWTNKSIAYHLGFSEPANFSAFFKQRTGVSPSQFKG